ncbi:6-phosphogluconate dehydrogenase C-terminal domain-like protein [Nadsonia fulvescens var. elongata DSM 6958]|uniref:6-phosphogluconate dehydrogenase C-terminal domain-like protein n=1 Tax=Nadsonia fulvescens var. elongata DSM 6958 TaxID=857566 RepID=A0A1E3PDX5_9ASCO|nr:6-phosphogluconate dehydrogenase C-terminal domain-like protein [Nadsonia fulvescens var. elongata DSM 6958]
MMNIQSVLFIGSGAVGTVFGNLLVRYPGIKTIGMVARSNYEILKTSGITMKMVLPDEVVPDQVFKPDVVISNIDIDAGKYTGDKYDLVVVATKGAVEAVKGLEQVLGPESIIMLAQNGVGIEKTYRDFYPHTALVSAVVRTSSELRSTGLLVQFAKKFHISCGLVYPTRNNSEYEFYTEKLEQFSKDSLAAGITGFDIVDDIEADRWEKVLWNGTYNTLCAISDLGPAAFQNSGCVPECDPPLYTPESLVRDVLTEIHRVGTASIGQDRMVGPEKIEQLLEWTGANGLNGFIPSTLQDVRKGKEIEFGPLCGNIIRAARRVNVPTPTLNIVYALLQAVNYRIKSQLKDKQCETKTS